MNKNNGDNNIDTPLPQCPGEIQPGGKPGGKWSWKIPPRWKLSPAGVTPVKYCVDLVSFCCSFSGRASHVFTKVSFGILTGALRQGCDIKILKLKKIVEILIIFSFHIALSTKESVFVCYIITSRFILSGNPSTTLHVAQKFHWAQESEI